jgi:hypothetical protein
MAERNKDLVARLADISEGAIQRLAEAPVADRAFQAVKGLGDRVDELQRRMRGYDQLEQRLSALEKRVDALAKRRSSSGGRTRARTTKSSSAAKKS